MDDWDARSRRGALPPDLELRLDRVWRGREESALTAARGDELPGERALLGYLGLNISTDLLMERLRGPVDHL